MPILSDLNPIGEPMIVYRPDRKTLRALGGLKAMKGLPIIEWQCLGQGPFAHWEPLSWKVPDEKVAGLPSPPLDRGAIEERILRACAGGRHSRA